MKAKFELLVFDWDGTLMDSVEHIVASLAAAARDINAPTRHHSELRDIIGLGLREALDRLYPQMDDDEITHLCERYRYHFVEASTVQSSLFSGAEQMLGELQNKGLKLAVATGKARVGLQRVFDDTGYGDYFSSSRCADESGSKPKPHMLHELMQELSVPAEKTLMIGDTAYDMEMAHNAGTASLAVSYGVHDCERMGRYSPLDCVHSIDELGAWLHAHTA